MAEQAARWGDVGSGSALILLRGRQHRFSATGREASVPSKTHGLKVKGVAVLAPLAPRTVLLFVC